MDSRFVTCVTCTLQRPNVATRIVAVTDELFENSGRTAIPNVDTVRRKAHVNMNDASRVMRAWRLAQRTAVTPVPNTVPERLRDASQSLLLTLCVFRST